VLEQNAMNNLVQLGAVELAHFLSASLPPLSDTWWQQHVVDRLSFQQQRMIQERGCNTLVQLDFAALLRVLDQNWYELSARLLLPREGRNWVKELQNARNRWAHLSAQGTPASEVHRDADTLGRFLAMIGASATTLAAVEQTKSLALRQMTTKDLADADHAAPAALASTTPSKESATETAAASTTATPGPSFNCGDLVALRSNPAQVMSVLDVIQVAGENRYRVFHNNAKSEYYESQLQALVEADDERATLVADELRAYLTSLQLLSPSTANLFSLRSGRVNFVPYQYRPVLKLIRADQPRLLISDEVGVGKTIEAGLIIKELCARMDLSSVLIICPKALVAEKKWFLEMKRFDEDFTALDGPLLRHCLNETHLDGEWPEKYGKAILPFSLFDSELVFGAAGRTRTRDRGLLNLDPPPKFDLVIVDEAHHIRNPETILHQGIRYFCDNAQAVLFLTATPVQLGSDDLFTLLNVLRPDLVIDPASFAAMAEPNRHINAAVTACRRAQDGWQAEARANLERAAQTTWGRLFVRESPAFQAAYDRLQEGAIGATERVGLTRAIEELYTFSALINRTRRRDIGEFTTRKPETVSIAFRPAQQDLHDHLLDVTAQILAFQHGQQNVKFMMTTIRRQAASCLHGLAPLLRDLMANKLDQLEIAEISDVDLPDEIGFAESIRSEITELLARADNLPPDDYKVDAFIKVLQDKRQLPNNKALVFSTFRHTLAYLAEHLQRADFRFGLIHGGIPDEERAELRRRFALPKTDADALDVLLSSEVGCEGLDFQFCDFLVNYDLPWNPMRIEQRIGRIDRYGQPSEAVAIVNFVTPGTVDGDIYERCLLRIGVFQHAIGGSEEILGEITRELHEIADRFDLTPAERASRLQQLADNSVRQINEEQELEIRQAELFGLNVPNQSWRQEIAAAESAWLAPAALQRCVALYLEKRLGPDQSYLLGEKPLKTLRLSQEARSKLLEDFRQLPRSSEPPQRAWEKWLKGDQPTLSVTLEQAIAAENPKSVHLSVTHPLVRQAARHLRMDAAAYAVLSVQSDELPPGEHCFGIYRWQKQGVKPDETLVAIAAEPLIEEKLLTLLQTARPHDGELPEQTAFDALDARHYERWRAAQANHMDENRQLVEHRIHSLTVSHAARCKVLGDQLARTTNDKIRLMKQSELARAEADFQRRLEELEKVAGAGDIQAATIVFGVVSVEMS
jgi:ATP-dependent helicase HepA